MKRSLKTILVVVLALAMTFGFSAFARQAKAEEAEPMTAGFVTFGLGGDFFQMLADQFVKTFEEAGWEASYEDGAFDPTKQIEAAENYIAMGVDVLFIWSVAPEAMGTVVQQAMDAGIKVIAFVAQTEQFDACMLSDDARLADSLNFLAAKWIDEKFADAEDHSVPVAVFSCRTADTGVLQADELIKIEEFSTKAKFVQEVELQDETEPAGLAAAENLYAQNPDIKVFLTAHNGLALGINNYFTGLSSPVQDYSDMGIYCVNGDNSIAELIKTSAEDAVPFRGMVMTGGVEDTANEMFDVASGLFDGTYEPGYIRYSGTLYINAETADEFLTTGTVTAITDADFVFPGDEPAEGESPEGESPEGESPEGESPEDESPEGESPEGN